MTQENILNFNVLESEQHNLKLWLERHDQKCKLKKKGKHRFLTYCFTPNGISSSIEVKCSCGKSVDITDVNQW